MLQRACLRMQLQMRVDWYLQPFVIVLCVCSTKSFLTQLLYSTLYQT